MKYSVLKAVKEIIPCSKNWSVFILHQFPSYDLSFPLPPFLISAAYSNSICEDIYYYGVGKRPMTKRLTKHWWTKYHPADSFPTFSPAISSTKYQCLDWLTLEIFFRDMCSRTWVPEDCKLSNHCISVNPNMDISNSWVLYSNRLCFQSFFHHPCGILGQWRNWRLT